MIVRVTKCSTITVARKIYSVPARLIGENAEITLYSDRLELRYAQKLIETIPRVSGKKCHYIQYHHIIEALSRKPGAFANYKYQEDMFPTSRFRLAYDELYRKNPLNASKENIAILKAAARLIYYAHWHEHLSKMDEEYISRTAACLCRNY